MFIFSENYASAACIFAVVLRRVNLPVSDFHMWPIFGLRYYITALSQHFCKNLINSNIELCFNFSRPAFYQTADKIFANFLTLVHWFGINLAIFESSNWNDFCYFINRFTCLGSIALFIYTRSTGLYWKNVLLLYQKLINAMNLPVVTIQNFP